VRPPAFWSNPPGRPGWQARALAPAAALWRLAARRGAARAVPYRAPVPVICVGNLTAGGAGKTPLVAALLRRLAAQGRAAHVVSRGHGGRLAGPHRVDPARDSHREVGDEALMLAALAPVWVARDRAAGVRAAAEAGAPLVILDDGFQNPGVAKDRSILVVDAVQGFGNGRLIPAGPLREPVAEGLARADAVLLVGTPPEREAAIARWPALAAAIPARLVPVETGLSLKGERVVAFAGIGRPGKFFATLAALGAELAEAIPFPDHAGFAPAVLRRLARTARANGAMLVTTEKDAARLPPAFRREVTIVQVRLEPADWTELDHLLASVDGFRRI
jgi:tetraacyldisaccharide 4'-kinase